ncbi:MAG: Unknown protein [uncultured Sulfurovum sp.]|uniref:DNA 3'-5' helicase II n=1 Tax=uncultured Sulfurovum sp. TaxID=269237 RepID=A0A6S6SKD2_9BACT|nr:MAG: Unknown protein [uncultured Sulfurovum sp.]
MFLPEIVTNNSATRYKIAYLKNFEETPSLKKTIDFLKLGDFKSAETKKLVNTDYFRAKINYEDRLVFTFIHYKNENYILLLEVIYFHRYEKSRFLRNIHFIEEDIRIEEEEIPQVDYMNKEKEFLYIDKFLSFTPQQKGLLSLKTPLIIVGSAGSGKTSVSIEKLRNLKGRVLYCSLSNYLVEKTEELCRGQENIDFLTFGEVLNRVQKQTKTGVSFTAFKLWAYWHKISEVEKYYEEFNGILTGSHEYAYLNKSSYMELGIKQSLFPREERATVYLFFQKYLDWIKDENFYNSNIVAFNLLTKVKEKYDFLVIDEVQDFTNIQIYFLFKALKNHNNFIFAGDSNQILYANFFSWTNLKAMLLKETKESQVQILKENYRNSKKITSLSNKLLKIKKLRFGSIDKESNYLSYTSSKIEGEIHFIVETKEVLKELNEETKESVDFAIIVLDEKLKSRVTAYFDSPLIFTVQEAKGLEYKNVILIGFVSSNASKFNNIVSNISKIELDEALNYGRQKDKENRDLEAYKVYINSLYVAFTRGSENLYIIESKRHRIFEILGLIEEKKQKIKIEKSSALAWVNEAEKLKKLNRVEQLDKIVEKNLEDKSFELKCSPQINKEVKKNVRRVHTPNKDKKVKVESSLKELIQRVFNVEKAIKNDKSKLFKMAKQTNNMEIIERLSKELNFKVARLYLLECNTVNSKRTKFKNPFATDMSGISLATMMKLMPSFTEIKESIESNANLEMKDSEGRTALIVAVQSFKYTVVKLLLEHGADREERYLGKTALDIAIEKEDSEIIKLFELL